MTRNRARARAPRTARGGRAAMAGPPSCPMLLALLALWGASGLPDELKSAASTIYLVGSMPQGLRTEWLGAYDQLGKTKRWRSGL